MLICDISGTGSWTLAPDFVYVYMNRIETNYPVCRLYHYLILVKYIHIFIAKSNFVVDFTSMLSCFRRPGAVFTKGLNQVLGLTFVQKYSQLTPETWLRPSVNTAPGSLFLPRVLN